MGTTELVVAGLLSELLARHVGDRARVRGGLEPASSTWSSSWTSCLREGPEKASVLTKVEEPTSGHALRQVDRGPGFPPEDNRANGYVRARAERTAFRSWK